MPAELIVDGNDVRATGRAMGSEYLVVLHENDVGLVADVRAGLADLEQRWSRFLPDSEISVLNRAEGRPVIVSPETFAVVADAVAGARATEGRFDPTVHDALIGLGYDRTFEEIGATGAAGAGASASPAPGVDSIRLDEQLNAIILPPGVRLDLGGIGKGAAADLLCNHLIERGALGAAVSIGGDGRVRGESPAGGPWQVTHDGEPLDLPPIIDGGICTSAITKRRWQVDGATHHHLVDPRSGASVEPTIESVTVVGATAAQAEILAKAAMVAGRAAPALLAGFGVAAVIRWATDR